MLKIWISTGDLVMEQYWTSLNRLASGRTDWSHTNSALLMSVRHSFSALCDSDEGAAKEQCNVLIIVLYRVFETRRNWESTVEAVEIVQKVLDLHGGTSPPGISQSLSNLVQLPRFPTSLLFLPKVWWSGGAFGRFSQGRGRAHWMDFTLVGHACHCEESILKGIFRGDGKVFLKPKLHSDFFGLPFVWFGAIPLQNDGQGPVFDNQSNRYGPILVTLPFQHLLKEYAKAHDTSLEKLQFTFLGERCYKQEQSHVVMISSPEYPFASCLPDTAKLNPWGAEGTIIRFLEDKWQYDVQHRAHDQFDHPEFVFHMKNDEEVIFTNAQLLFRNHTTYCVHKTKRGQSGALTIEDSCFCSAEMATKRCFSDWKINP